MNSSSGSMQVSMPTDLDIVMTRVFDAPRQMVFDAWTKPEYMKQWLLGPEGWSMPICEVDLRVGGRWRGVWRHSDGNEFEITGVYREIIPPAKLVATETWGDGNWPETLNTLIFTEKEGKTTATQTVSYPSKEARDAAMQTGMTKGFAASLDRLAELLALKTA